MPHSIRSKLTGKTISGAFCISALTLGLLSGCGGGAGDDDTPQTNDAAIAAVAPLEGVWNLPDNWDGDTGGKAYLAVDAPDDQGEAAASVYTLDLQDNCYNLDAFAGDITQSLTDDLFLEVPAIPSAIVELQPNGQLQISVYSEAAGTGVPPERVLLADRLGITQDGIQICN